MTGLGVRRWLGVHRWTSLACTLFLLVSCITGLPLIFEDELAGDAPAERRAPAHGAAPPLSIDAIAAQLAAETPRRFVQFVFFADSRDDSVGFGLAATPDAPLEDVQRVRVDVHNGAPLPPARAGWAPLDTLGDLHRDLLLGDVGSLVLGAIALCFVASLISGTVIYGPFMRRLDFGTIRDTATRTRWLDLHNLIGIASVGWALVVGATGLMNTLEGRLFAIWQAERLPAMLSAHEHDAPVVHATSLAAAVDAARNALPAMRVTSIGLAGTRYGTPGQHLVWLHGTSALEKRLFATALIDPADGRVVQAEALPWYLRALEVSRPLHFGDYGGLPLKVLWAAFDLLAIAVLCSGVYLWASKGHSAASPRVVVAAASRVPTARRSTAAVFATPALLAVATLIGLVAALLSEAAAFRWTAWLALGAGVALIAQRVVVARHAGASKLPP